MNIDPARLAEWRKILTEEDAAHAHEPWPASVVRQLLDAVAALEREIHSVIAAATSAGCVWRTNEDGAETCVNTERDAVKRDFGNLLDDCLAALSRFTLTPAEGYRDHPPFILTDIHRLGKERDVIRARLQQHGEWCDTCNTPQFVLPSGEHVCRPHIASWLYTQWQTAQTRVAALERELVELRMLQEARDQHQAAMRAKAVDECDAARARETTLRSQLSITIHRLHLAAVHQGLIRDCVMKLCVEARALLATPGGE